MRRDVKARSSANPDVTEPASSAHPLGVDSQHFEALEDEVKRAAAKVFLNSNADRGARSENHGPRELFKRPVAVGDAKPGYIMDRLVLQIAPSAGVIDR